MRFKVRGKNYINSETDLYESHMPLTETTINRVVNGHDSYGYIIISASRTNLYRSKSHNTVYGKNYIEEDSGHKLYDDEELLQFGTQINIDENNKRTKNIRNKLSSMGYSFIPVYGGYKETGTNNAHLEKSFIVFPFDHTVNNFVDFDVFFNDLMELGKDFNQDSILVKFPNKNPQYYDCITRQAVGKEFKSAKLNDMTQEYFTALKKYSDSHSDVYDFMSRSADSKPQRFTLEEIYMNKFPNSIAEHRIRSMSGELVRFEHYPK